jgi:carbonic anhydrase
MPKFLGLFHSSLKTPDEFIYGIAQNKDEQNQRLFKLMKDVQKKKSKPKIGAMFHSRTVMPEKSDYAVT